MAEWYERSAELCAYKMDFGILMDREYVLTCPKEGTANGRWVLKTEYFGAFPEVELALLERGYHIAHIRNKTRWCLAEDTDAQAALAVHLHETRQLAKKCVVVGMSCGGMQGIYLGAKYPQYISCMFLDAPVVNFLSCPVGLGKGTAHAMEEFENAKGMGVIELLSYREHPLDYIPQLTKNNIPLFLACGDSDSVVPFEENGALLKKAYEESGIPIVTVMKKGGEHHPHCLPDNTPILDFIAKYDRD